MSGGNASTGDQDAPNLVLDHAEIAANPFGITYDTFGAAGRVSIRNSHVQGGKSAVALAGAFTADLGTMAAPGNNRFEVDDGDRALIDSRDSAGPAIEAHGTTLNGVSYDGDIVGPAASAGYGISGPNTIHF